MSIQPRLAVISTIYFPPSHSDVIVTRWLKPFETDRQFGWPATGYDKPRADIVGAYIKEFNDDIGRGILSEHNCRIKYKRCRSAIYSSLAPLHIFFRDTGLKSTFEFYLCDTHV